MRHGPASRGPSPSCARRSTAPRRPEPRQGSSATTRAEMITPTTSTDPLVEALATQLRLIDLVGWQRIATWAEQSELSFEDLRLLLALALKIEDGPAAVSELGDLAGFSVDVAYPAIHSLRRRGYLREERRRYSLSQRGESSSPCWMRRTARASRHTSTHSITRSARGFLPPSRRPDESPHRKDHSCRPRPHRLSGQGERSSGRTPVVFFHGLWLLPNLRVHRPRSRFSRRHGSPAARPRSARGSR